MLDIILIHSADLEKQPPTTDFAGLTGERLDFEEWEAIFFFELIGYCPWVSKNVPEFVDIGAWLNLWQQGFQEALPDYPLLARMWNEYEDAIYEPGEIKDFRSECLAVQSKIKNETALKGLDKLLRCCDRAAKDDLGLFMACD